MRHGRAPTIKRGPYKGDELAVDHLIPRAVVPELDHVIANLELLPLRMTESKNANVGERQFGLAHCMRMTPAIQRVAQVEKELPARVGGSS